MTDDASGQGAPPSANVICCACGSPLSEAWLFCPACGSRRIPDAEKSTIDVYVEDKINASLSKRLESEANLVREIGDKAEDIVWSRLKRYGIVLGILFVVIAFFGVKSIDDLTKRVEPIVTAAEERAKTAQRTIEETASRIDSTKAALDQLSADVDTQTKRVTDKGGEIARKLESLEADAREVEMRGETYKKRSEEISQQLETMTKGLESRVAQVSKQVMNIQIQQAYPTLGQQKFTTYQGGKWRGKEDKSGSEKWVSIGIDPNDVSEIAPDAFERLLVHLKDTGYTPYIGMFGVGGPYNSGTTLLGDNAATAVFYYQRDGASMAAEIASIVQRTLGLPEAPVTRFVDASIFSESDVRRYVIENAGLDAQIYFYRMRK